MQKVYLCFDFFCYKYSIKVYSIKSTLIPHKNVKRVDKIGSILLPLHVDNEKMVLCEYMLL